MATVIIWWAAIALEALLVVRSVQAALLKRYPFFFAYVISVLLCDSLLYWIYKCKPEEQYLSWARNTEVLNLVLGYGIVLEIFRHVLSQYPGAERFARLAGVSVFTIIVSVALIYALVSPGTTGVQAARVELERNFLAVQAIFLFGILGVIYYYGLQVGENIKGMIVGYGIWLGTSLMTLAARSYIGSSFDVVWVYALPFSYLLALCVWLPALWTYQSVPEPNPDSHLEVDYESFVSTTRSVMGEMRAHLGRVVRP